MALLTNTTSTYNGLISIAPISKTISKHALISFPKTNSEGNLSYSHSKQIRLVVRAAEAEIMTTEKLGIKITTNPPESKLSQLGVRSWPKWGCPPSKFPWTYSQKETCYLLKGKVKVYPDGSDEAVEFGAGDMVVFPKGMSCTWDVSETVDKHYLFE
ncbi:Ethanolamine utilization eutQ [Heracleum sosnowskyi]|uniref:Ethanolamine utilization eutQ n=1 Tax=Heracleum sosnowskyi TaxID=360622 RepID=A0AAD8M945_9APIA|nr:Ethanolamine utilization eutQ [Heracleum sosnowskyi]